jgi:hypothetical protein
MNIDIQASENENFKITTKKFGDQHIASTGETLAIAPTPEEAIEKVVEQSLPQPVEVQRGSKPVSLENHRSSGVSWFEGTSWSTKQ